MPLKTTWPVLVPHLLDLPTTLEVVPTTTSADHPLFYPTETFDNHVSRLPKTHDLIDDLVFRLVVISAPTLLDLLKLYL
jgi:hypothetical protein